MTLPTLVLATFLVAAGAISNDVFVEADKLVAEQKYEAASIKFEEILLQARANKNESIEAGALIRLTKSRVALGGFEIAVNRLRDEKWPQAPLEKTKLELFYAHSLATYLATYFWEIQQRERVETKAKIDLKSMTTAQLYDEAQAAFSRALETRETLGARKLSVLEGDLQPNNYPAGIRDTFRDAMTYFAVELLENSTFWSPEASNDVFRLPFQKLLTSPAVKMPTNALMSNSHPIEKSITVLLDLEAWHASRNEREAAAEARRKRLNVLHAHFTNDRQRAAIRQELGRLASSIATLEWSALIRSNLAEWIEGDIADRKLARVTCLVAVQKHPTSLGGQRCQFRIAEIELPELHMELAANDLPNRRSIVLRTRNMSHVYFRAYVLSSSDPNRTEIADDRVRALVKNGQPIAEWGVAVPRLDDFQLHDTHLVPKVNKRGRYVIVASSDSAFKEPKPFVAGLLNLSNLTVVVEATYNRSPMLIRVFDATSGAPRSGVKVQLFVAAYSKPSEVLETVVTNASGSAELRYSTTSYRGDYFLLIEKDDDRIIHQEGLNFYKYRDSQPNQSVLIFTDRSVFRPQQTVNFKVVSFAGNSTRAEYKTIANQDITLRLLDSNGQQVETKKLETNGFGSASGQFKIPAGRKLGRWTLSANNATTSLTVEEYKRPTFEAHFKDVGQGFRLGAPATLVVEAKYLFGQAVTSAKLKWVVERTPRYPWWWSWYFFRNETRPFVSQVMAAGQGVLTASGTAEVTFTPEADPELSKDIQYSYKLSVDVTDDGGETRSATKNFTIGRVAIDARVNSEQSFFDDHSSVSVKAMRTSLDGEPRAGKARFRLISLEKPSSVNIAEQPRTPMSKEDLRNPDDVLYRRWSIAYDAQAELRALKDGKTIRSGDLEHGQEGNAKLELGVLPAGAYRVRYETTDNFGSVVTTAYEFLVTNEKFVSPLPLSLSVDVSKNHVGDSTRIYVSSGLSSQPVILSFFREGVRFREELVNAQNQTQTINFSIDEKLRGGFSVRATLVRDNIVLHEDASLFVPFDNKELSVGFERFRDTMKPGAKETFKVKLSSKSGTLSAQTAEVLAYMYDASLDAIGSHTAPNVLALYPGRMGAPYLNLSTRPSYIQEFGTQYSSLTYPSLKEDELMFFPGNFRRGRVYYRKGGFAEEEAEHDLMNVAAAKTLSMPAAAPPREAKELKKEKSAEMRADGKDSSDASSAPTQLRSNFAETAFFFPHLVADANGDVSIEFQVPDSLTEWNVWVHALTRDLRGGSAHKTTRSVKDLMVRPYLPRFLREGDSATLNVTVNNATATPQNGTLELSLFDAETKQPINAEFQLKPIPPVAFEVAANKSTTLSYSVVAPRRVGLFEVRAVAKTKTDTDGELRALPVLPSRMHLTQSRFVALKGNSTREMSFADMTKKDATRENEKLVVTLDAQLFYSVLQALPYLRTYPYECLEQTLNRFLSSGIVSSVFQKHPAVAAMAKEMSKRATEFERFDDIDANRKTLLEESPWLQESKGGNDSQDNLRLLNPAVAQAERESALTKITKAQYANGGFPWYTGGPPSMHVTLYMLLGFSRAAEFEVAVPVEAVQKAWSFVGQKFKADYPQCFQRGKDCPVELVTLLNFVATSFPSEKYLGDALTKPERLALLEVSFAEWKNLGPLLKGYLALTLKRTGRPADAKLVFDSVMDASKTNENEGTFWQPEDRSWLWYNDTIESHAFSLRVLTELNPKDKHREGLVQWLFLNKKLNHWKSTRATAEVIYALVKYLGSEKQLDQVEKSLVTIGPIQKDFVFDPTKYTGRKNQMVVEGKDIREDQMSKVRVENKSQGLQFASTTWHFSTENIPTESRGDMMSVKRTYFRRVRNGNQMVLQPLSEGAHIAVGDELEINLSIRSKAAMEYVHLRDPRGAGFEPEAAQSRYHYDLGLVWFEEYRDSATNFFFENLPQGEYQLKYRVRAATAGAFRTGPAVLQSMYAPEFSAYSSGAVLTIDGASN